MVLSLNDHREMLKGFGSAGFVCATAPGGPQNPVRLEWHVQGQVRRYRLWAFDITHGGGGSEVRAADEFRIQITNGPPTSTAFDSENTTDLLIGYSRDRDAIVAYDRRWLESWTQKKQTTGSGGSPSVQVKEADIEAGHNNGIHHLTKSSNFGVADIVTMNPNWLPAYLLNHNTVLRGQMTATQAQTAAPQSPGRSIVDYCRSQGFPFEPDLIARYLAAALTKPLVILAGVSGTGKSKLAELVAEFYSADLEPLPENSGHPPSGESFIFVPSRGTPNLERFALVAVRPDWIDNQSILGFVNPITNKYESTQSLDLVLRARAALEASPDPATAPRFFMLFDEMNLARVEHYFSDWLACTESRRYRPDGAISQQPVPLHRMGEVLTAEIQQPGGAFTSMTVPPSLQLPTNLMITGTVNVDETTYGFSPKVLDRAMVLEFDEVDLERLRNGGSGVEVGGYKFPDSLPPFRLPTGGDYGALPDATHRHIIAINEILQGARLHLGYRAANEIALFMTLYQDMLPPIEDDDWLRALDAAILQKVLPRLSGNRARLEGPLVKFCIYLRDLVLPADISATLDFDISTESRLPRSYKRGLEMLNGLRDFGFVSFFK